MIDLNPLQSKFKSFGECSRSKYSIEDIKKSIGIKRQLIQQSLYAIQSKEKEYLAENQPIWHTGSDKTLRQALSHIGGQLNKKSNY